MFKLSYSKPDSSRSEESLIVMCFLSAYCKNSVDGQWYCFDDSDVQQLPENEVCKQTAYILFYQRRTAIPSWSANSSVAGKPRWHRQGVVVVYLSWIGCLSEELSAHLCLSPHSLSQNSARLVSVCCASEAVGKLPPLLLRLVVAKRLWKWGNPPPPPWVILLRAALVKTMT